MTSAGRCQYQIDTSRDDVFGCDSPKIVTGGVVPKSWCERCPVWEPVRKLDFFQQTARLWVTKSRSGDYRPTAKPCGGCGPTKHKIDLPTLQFIWPYWGGGSRGDELRWSIRSVETYFQGHAKILLIGDKPDWYHGPIIRKNRVPPNRPNRAFRDMLSKMWFMATKPEVNDTFVWMMDDVYFLKPFTLSDVQQARAERYRPSGGNSWQRRKQNTMQALADRQRTQHDYATHLPHFVEKQKLRDVYEEFDLHNNTLLWEVLYGNTYREPPATTRPFFLRINRQMSTAEVVERAKTATIFNHTSSAWCHGVRDFLAGKLPTPSTAEGGEVPAKPTYRMQAKKQRVVKRRPK